MPRARARYQFVPEECSDAMMVIRDTGPTVTNDADAVVEDLAAAFSLLGRRLFYYDSDGHRDELLHDGRRFTGFAPGRRDA